MVRAGRTIRLGCGPLGGLAQAVALALAMVVALAPARLGADETAPIPLDQRTPGLGPVTNLPLPRYVSLKTGEGNARRGPGLNHRIDWVFTVEGMPLRVTAEYEHWRRIEDVDGAGGWIHYSLLSSARSVLVTQDMAEFLTLPETGASVAFQAEYGVIGWVQECLPDWCRIAVEGRKGWAPKTALWGVDPGEIVE